MGAGLGSRMVVWTPCGVPHRRSGFLDDRSDVRGCHAQQLCRSRLGVGCFCPPGDRPIGWLTDGASQGAVVNARGSSPILGALP